MLELSGVDAVALKEAVALVLRRHPALRSRFRPDADGGADNGSGHLRYWTDGSPPTVKLVTRTRRNVDRAVRETCSAGFDLARDAPARAAVLAAGGGRTMLALCAHRIVLDEWSRQLLVTQIGEAYRAVSQHRTPRLADAAHPADVQSSIGEDDSTQAGRTGAVVAGLRGAPIEVRLPRDRPRPRSRPSEGGTHRGSLGPELTERLRAVADRNRCTTLVTMSALLAATLTAETGQTDFLFGFDWLGRRQLERRHAVGMFTNTLLLRANLTGAPGWRELLAGVRAAWLASSADADVPFDAVAAALGINPVPQVMVNVHGGPFRLPDLGPGVSCRELVVPRAIAHELMLDVTERTDDVLLELGYPAEVFEPATARRLLMRLRRRAAELVNSLDGALSTGSAGGLLAGMI